MAPPRRDRTARGRLDQPARLRVRGRAVRARAARGARDGRLLGRARASGVPSIFVNDAFHSGATDLKALAEYYDARGGRAAELLAPLDVDPDVDHFVAKPHHSGSSRPRSKSSCSAGCGPRAPPGSPPTSACSPPRSTRTCADSRSRRRATASRPRARTRSAGCWGTWSAYSTPIRGPRASSRWAGRARV